MVSQCPSALLPRGDETCVNRGRDAGRTPDASAATRFLTGVERRVDFVRVLHRAIEVGEPSQIAGNRRADTASSKGTPCSRADSYGERWQRLLMAGIAALRPLGLSGQ